MRRWILGLALAVLAGGMGWEQVAQAAGGGSCGADSGMVTFEKGDRWGFTINEARKYAPNYVVVAGQDPKKTGVSINVELEAHPGRVSYQRWSSECVRSNVPKADAIPCYAGGQPGYWYQRGCVTHTETVYRYIDPYEVTIWLEADNETMQYIGWRLDQGRYPFRYLYPEEWGLGTWTPDGITTLTGDKLYFDDDIKGFTDDNPGFDYLFADPREVDVPGYSLLIAENPVGGNPALALYGKYKMRDYGFAFGGGCMIRGREKGDCALTYTRDVNYVGGRIDPVIKLGIDLMNAPLDLPGRWYIGVMVKVNRAFYDNESLPENVDEESLIRKPNVDWETGYEMTEDRSFYSYIILSTPCLTDEPGGCDN